MGFLNPLYIPFEEVGEDVVHPEISLRHKIIEFCNRFEEKNFRDVGLICFVEKANIVIHKRERFWEARIRTTFVKEKKAMSTTVIPEIRHLVTAIDENIKTKSVEKRHLYDTVMKGLILGFHNEEYRSNKVDRLVLPYFRNHPDVHQGYYDYKRDGILYVRDNETGNYIRKDESVLLCTGVFISRNSPSILNLDKRSDVEILYNALEKNCTTSKELLKNRYYFSYSFNRFLPVDLKQLEFAKSPRYISNVIKQAYTNVLNNLYGGHLEEDGGNIDQTFFTTFLEECERLVNTIDCVDLFLNRDLILVELLDKRITQLTYRIDDTSSLFKGSLVYSDQFENFNRTIRQAIHTDITQGLRPTIILNSRGDTNRAIGFDILNNRGATSTNLVYLDNLNINYNFPFVLAVYLPQALRNGVNKKTRNNEGVMMNYTARVPDFKKSFLMVPEEEERFKRNAKNVREKIKEHNQEILKLTKEMAETKSEVIYKNIKSKVDALRKKKPRLYSVEMPIFLGVELEYVTRINEEGFRNRLISDIANSSFGDHVLIKSDSSIERGPNGDGPFKYGFEIVTIPATLKYHKTMFEEHFFKKPNEFHKRLMSIDRCGIHVHIDKKAFTRVTLAKFITFINSKQNQGFINDLAGRTANRYCQRLHLVGKNSKGIDKSILIGKKINMEGRTNDLPRGAINLQTTDKTVEVRIFKASDNRNNVLRKIEFCEALILFCREVGIQQMTIYDFVDFLLRKENKKDYPYLIRWLASRNYIGHQRVKIKGTEKLANIYSVNKISKPDIVSQRKQNQADDLPF